MSDELLTANEAAQLLRVSGATVRRWVRLDLLRAVRLPSGQVRIRRSEVERVLRDEVKAGQREQPARAHSRTTSATAPIKKRDLKDRPSVAVAIIVHNGRALMTCRRWQEGPFRWNFVSGELEPGETPEQAAIREVREEVGLEVAVVELLGDRVQPVSKRHMYYLICRVTGGTVDLVDHEENTEVRWCTLEEVYERLKEVAQVPGGLYPPLFAYLDRVLVARAGR